MVMVLFAAAVSPPLTRRTRRYLGCTIVVWPTRLYGAGRSEELSTRIFGRRVIRRTGCELRNPAFRERGFSCGMLSAALHDGMPNNSRFRRRLSVCRRIVRRRTCAGRVRGGGPVARTAGWRGPRPGGIPGRNLLLSKQAVEDGRLAQAVIGRRGLSGAGTKAGRETFLFFLLTARTISCPRWSLLDAGLLAVGSTLVDARRTTPTCDLVDLDLVCRCVGRIEGKIRSTPTPFKPCGS